MLAPLDQSVFDKQKIAQTVKTYYNDAVFEIQDNGIVNVSSSLVLDFYSRQKNSIPVTFGRVEKSVDFFRSEITSLRGAPKEIKGNFMIDNSPKLTSLAHGPEYVGGYYSAVGCPLSDLTFLPKHTAFFIITWRNNLNLLPLLRCNSDDIGVIEIVHLGETHPTSCLINKFRGLGPEATLAAATMLVNAGFSGNIGLTDV